MNYIHLSDVISVAKVNRCGENDFPVLSITKSDGIVLQSEKFKKRIASTDTTNYKVVHRGQLVQGIHIDEANFGVQEVADVGIVSPAYKIWNIKSDAIIPKYLEIVLRSPRSIAYYASKFNGSIKRRERLSDKDFLQMRIPCPPMDEQIYAIEVLDKTATLIEKRKQQLTELDNLIKARFIELFGDLVFGDKITTNRHKIGEIASVTKLAGFEFTKYIQYKEQGEIIMLRGLNCKKGKLVLDDVKWIDKDTSDLLPRSKLFYGDILMTYAGTIGDVAMVDADNKYHLAPNVAKITLNDKEAYNPVFLMHLFMYSNDYIMTFASQVAQASINMEKIRNFEYYFPRIDMQNEFAAFVKQTDKSKAVVQKALDEAQTLFDSLMQEYFG